VPVYELRTVEEQISRSLTNERFVASLSSVLSALATLLAMVGLYGVMSHTVTRRTREMAIRVAFGAASSRVTTLIVRDMLTLVFAGVVLALPLIWWLDRFVRSQLYGVSPADPTAILAAVGTLLLAALLAIAVPSGRLVRVDPMAALRDE
jgi:putative ABC transport system permease protein